MENENNDQIIKMHQLGDYTHYLIEHSILLLVDKKMVRKEVNK